MEWLSQNWIWVAVALGVFFLMMRMHGGAMRHSTHQGHGSATDNPPRDIVTGPTTLFDPVSRRAVAPGGVSAVYRGRAYYFESRENRDAFEADAEKYLAEAPLAGQAIGSGSEPTHARRHRRGC